MLYVHIPFCKQRCIYCDFYSTTLSATYAHDYIEAVKNEIQHRASELPSRMLSSLYIGGGTPSLLPLSAIHQLFTAIRSHFTLANNAEVTFEANPDDITPELVDVLLSEGVNRISLGVQSLNEAQLQLLNRRHTASQAISAINLIHRLGMPHISIDLIYGQPRQTIDMWKADLHQALTLPIDHLSAYALTVEASTKLHRMLTNGTLTMPTDEETLYMYKQLCLETCRHGFQHYEISNFCLPNAHSRHNSGYWQGKSYLGIGPGAHSYDGVARKFNPLNLQQYIATSGITDRNTEKLTANERCNDFIITSLRTMDGLNLHTFQEKFGPERTSTLLKWAEPHINRQQLIHSSPMLKLTESGIFVSNDIISDLMFIDSD